MNLGKDFWNDKYLKNNIGWDLENVSPPIAAYFDQVENKELKILIPGAGNSHEAEHLFNHGFKNITVIDLSPTAIQNFKIRVPEFPKENTLVGDFFHLGGYFDIILEQTFFCALNKSLRPQYAEKTTQLLSPKGKLLGLMFNAPLNQDHPPFGGDIQEYQSLFSPYYNIVSMEPCYNSHPSRDGKEIWVKMETST
jgi:SAM-dependent methyltransferase